MIFKSNVIYNFFRIKNEHSIYLASIITGLLTGAVVLFFAAMLSFAEHRLERWFPDYSNPEVFDKNGNFNFHFGYIAFIFLPALGGLLTGLISEKFSTETSGSGMDSLISSFHQMEGKLRGRVALYKIFTTLFTISTGGSAGREGPIAQIGGSIGSKVNDLLGGGPKARRTLLLAGAAGGLGAIFHAPLGGAMTAVEMIYKEDIESDALLPGIISSMTAYLFYSFFAGFVPIYSPPGVVPVQPFQSYLFYLLLGFLSYWGGLIFIKLYNGTSQVFAKMNMPRIYKPALGGLMVGILGYFFPFILGSGEHFVQKIMEQNPVFHSMISFLKLSGIILLIVFLKILASSLTIGSGGSGGMFGPSLYIGGLIGFFVGSLAKFAMPDINFSMSSFMLVGMGAFYSGIARAPIAGMVMICEMIGSYVLLPPLMIGSILSLILSHNLAIYKSQLHNRFKSPAHSYDIDIMRKIVISEFLSYIRNKAIIQKSATIRKIKKMGSLIQASDFIVSNEKSEYVGMVSLRKQHKKFKTGKFVIEITEKNIPSVTTDNTLGDALNIILEYELDKVAVTSEGKLIGYLRFLDILNLYYETVGKQNNAKKTN